MQKMILKHLEERLERIEKGELDNGTITICHSGKVCNCKDLFRGHQICKSAVPCKEATTHYYSISKAI